MNCRSEKQPCQPFLKWAGGKRWLANQYSAVVPTKFRTYIEPFLGSGAMFFALQPPRAILADANAELIRTYRAIKNDWRGVERALRKHHLRHSRQHYYYVRASVPNDPHERAARLIYLNRTCWNGLYRRVNLQKGKFNVPIGTKTRVCLPMIPIQIHQLLSRAKLLKSDFEQVIAMAKTGDFLFVDPPYTTLHNENGFVKYNEKLFSWQDQIRLRDCLLLASQRGVAFVATNADHRSIRQLYSKHFLVQSLRRSSVIASDSRYRQQTRELLITTREVVTS